MDLDAPLDITIGPYETYNDELFGYKAGFEAYITIRDEAETNKLKTVAAHLQEVENNLPLDPRYRNPKLGASAPIRVVNEVYASGDGAHGVRTAAFNLPNDERVISEKGSARIMLKNIQEAKFAATLIPIAGRVLTPGRAGRSQLQLLLHPHPGARTQPRHRPAPDPGRRTRHHAAPGVEGTLQRHRRGQGRCHRPLHAGVPLRPQADGMDGPAYERPLYTTYLASAFRSVRFGVTEAHGKGMALQFNYFLDKGAFAVNPDGTFAVDVPKMKSAVRDLTHELLTIEAEGNYAAAKKMLDTLAVIRPAMQRALDGLKDLPTDVDPVNESKE